MTLSRKLVFSAILALAVSAGPAFADDTAIQCPPAKPHHVSHHKTRVRSAARHTGAAKTDTILRIAQEHLANLGYYNGKIDGIMGPATRDAIKRFQREHGLKADGVLGSKTTRALENTDRHHLVLGSHSQPLSNESRQGFGTAVLGNPADQAVDQDYELPLAGGTKALSSRFARVDASESGSGPDKHYIVNLNGQPILNADGQPGVIGMSVTYDLGNEDAIIFTTYAPDSLCLYKTHVLALSSAGSRILDIANCTRYYKAHADNGSLYVTFPEADDGRDVGATWRVEGMNLERL